MQGLFERFYSARQGGVCPFPKKINPWEGYIFILDLTLASQQHNAFMITGRLVCSLKNMFPSWGRLSNLRYYDI
jgi:hypothetical protein